jgi:integrating conjugative element protein (TIGR03765 family)
MEWFIEHRDRLAQIHAVGMLVHVETVADLEAIAAIADGLPVLPASATDIARSLALKHIPVLISRRGIEQ